MINQNKSWIHDKSDSDGSIASQCDKTSGIFGALTNSEAGSVTNRSTESQKKILDDGE